METADIPQTQVPLNGNTPENDETADPTPEARQRSTIAFPYGSLRDAEQVAQALQAEYGGSGSPDQVAAALGSTLKSGAFRIKLATARTFGLVDATRGNVELSPLGRRIIDPQTRDAARAEAFLAVPLFARVFAEYQGALLPPDAGLEKKMADLGVATKQTAKARQAFQRSAELAGFFRSGRDRLVRPPLNVGDSDPTTQSNHAPKEDDHLTPPPTATATVAEPVQAAWLKLLRDGSSWSPEQTHEYVQAARKLQELIDRLG